MTTVAQMFRRDNDNFFKNASKRFGQKFESIEDVWAAIDSEMRKHTKCICGYVCKNLDHLEQHQGNRECRRRQELRAAKLANTEYKPDYKKKKYCNICKVPYSRYFKHDKTTKHKKNLDLLLGKELELKCKLCNKEYSKKRSLIRHLKESKVCHRGITTAEKFQLYAAQCEKCNVRFDPTIAIKTGQTNLLLR